MPGSPAARGCEGDSLPGERKSGELRRGARADAGDRSGEERAGEGHADRLDWAALGFRLEWRLWRGAAGEERVAASGTARNGRRQTERVRGNDGDGRRDRWWWWRYTGSQHGGPPEGCGWISFPSAPPFLFPFYFFPCSWFVFIRKVPAFVLIFPG